MLNFLVFDDGKPATSWPLRNPCLVGSDHSAMRGSITFANGMIVCEKRETGAAALSLQAPAGDCGELTLQTCLLPDRDEPYILYLELARHRVMMLYTKLEDWAMFDIVPDHPVSKRLELARKLLIEALCQQRENPARAEKLSRDSLVAAVDGSEELALAHADLLLARRKATGSLPRYAIGCGVCLDETNDRLRSGIQAAFDFVSLPAHWKSLAPAEGDYHFEPLDQWVEWAARSRIPVIAGPIISFEPSVLPDWLFIWEHDYETVRDVIYEHVERTVTRYRNGVHTWKVVSGLHVNSHFTFNFEQLMDLTRTTTMLVKKIQPTSRVLVEIRQPFGEYYATNARSIPPLMYADLLIQGAINFDGLSIKLLMGQAVSGQFTRDLMQISNMLDQFAVYGKPLHVTIAAPSEPVTQEMIAAPDGGPVDADSGRWRKPWSQNVQSHWMEAVIQMAMSKPFVDSVTWHELCDHQHMELPLSGLLTEELHPKTAFRRLAAVRRSLGAAGGSVPGGVASPPAQHAPTP